MLLKEVKGIFEDYHGHLWYVASALKNMNIKPQFKLYMYTLCIYVFVCICKYTECTNANTTWNLRPGHQIMFLSSRSIRIITLSLYKTVCVKHFFIKMLI